MNWAEDIVEIGTFVFDFNVVIGTEVEIEDGRGYCVGFGGEASVV